MKYTTILMLDYFEETLKNVGLPKAWLGYDSNHVTQNENKCVKLELNQIGGEMSKIQSKTVIWIKSEMMSEIK